MNRICAGSLIIVVAIETVFIVVMILRYLSELETVNLPTRGNTQPTDTTHRHRLDQAYHLEIPQDVSWFIPEIEGWLCDYKYHRNANGSTVIKILPRNTGLGKIMVYAASKVFPGTCNTLIFRCDRRYGAVNRFYSALRSSRSLLNEDKWVIIAMDYFGNLDRMFATSAEFGTTSAFVGLVSSFQINQEIYLKNLDYDSLPMPIAKERFPGIVGVNETVRAYN